MEAKNEVNTANTKDAEGHTANEETKIVSVVNEKVKDPRRVAQGKKLAAISRQAKERKAKEREAAIRKEEAAKCKEEKNFFNGSNTLYAIIPIIGIALGGYYFLCLRPTKEEKPNLKKL